MSGEMREREEQKMAVYETIAGKFQQLDMGETDTVKEFLEWTELSLESSPIRSP